MKKYVFILLSIVFVQVVVAQRESGSVWVTPFVSTSLLNNGNDMIDYYGCDAKVLNSAGWGYELGYNFNRLYMFLSIGEEFTNLSKNDVSLDIKTWDLSYNFAYPLWRSNSQRFSMDLRLGIGLYNSNIDYAKEISNLKPINEIVKQRYNLYLPVGVSFNLYQNSRSCAKINLLYRHSFDTGNTKYFGSDKKISDFPLNKLGSLQITVGYTIGI